MSRAAESGVELPCVGASAAAAAALLRTGGPAEECLDLARLACRLPDDHATAAALTPRGLAELVGDGLPVPCVDGSERPYLNLDAAASTSALPAVAERVAEFLPWYSSVHRGTGYKSQLSTAAYEDARAAILSFAGRAGSGDVAIVCRNTTEAINHLAYRLALEPSDVVATTVVEHHANLLPWRRAATLRYIECDTDGTFHLDSVRGALDASPTPRLLAMTGASNVTGWLPPLEAIIALARERGVPVVVDAAQLAPHRPLPQGADFIAFSGHKLYAPFGAGAPEIFSPVPSTSSMSTCAVQFFSRSDVVAPSDILGLNSIPLPLLFVPSLTFASMMSWRSRRPRMLASASTGMSIVLTVSVVALAWTCWRGRRCLWPGRSSRGWTGRCRPCRS